ncbi:MAG: hypothetical protein Q9183_006751, partial [Haloplaca sp. 2 TL-2023]
RTGKSALSYAVREGYGTIVELLLKNGSKINNLKGDLFDNTPIALAKTHVHTRIVKLLLDHGVPDGGDGFMCSALRGATRHGHTASVELLLDYGIDVDSSGDFGETALSIAAHYDYPAIVKLLLAYRANVEVMDRNGYTPLVEALRNGGRINSAIRR